MPGKNKKRVNNNSNAIQAKMPTTKVVERKENRPREAVKRETTFIDKVKSVGKKAWEWFKTGGWEQVLSLTLSFLDSPEGAHLKGYKDSGVIPAGTVLFTKYLSPEDFPDTSLENMAANFTYWEFVETFLRVSGVAAADDATGQLAVFVCNDPTLEIVSATPTQIENLVLENNGKLVRLDRTVDVPVPSPDGDVPLHVRSDGSNLRWSKQGQVFVVAYTDIDLTSTTATVQLRYNIRLARSTSQAMTPMPPKIESLGAVMDSGTAIAPSSGTTTVDATCTFASYIGDFCPGLRALIQDNNLYRTGALSVSPGTYKCYWNQPFIVTTASNGLVILALDVLIDGPNTDKYVRVATRTYAAYEVAATRFMLGGPCVLVVDELSTLRCRITATTVSGSSTTTGVVSTAALGWFTLEPLYYFHDMPIVSQQVTRKLAYSRDPAAALSIFNKVELVGFPLP